MTNNLLEELEIPHPPYRMSRPVAALAAVDQPLGHRADEMSEEALKSEFEKALPETKAEEEPTSPESIDASVDVATEKAEQSIDAVTILDDAAKKDAKDAVLSVRESYQGHVGQMAAEFSGEKKNLGSVEQEYDSAEAALRRAEAAQDQKEITRLTKLTQQYSDALESKASESPVVTPDTPEPAPVASVYESELERMRAKQAELRAAGNEKEAAAYDEGIAKYEKWKREQDTKSELPSAAADDQRQIDNAANEGMTGVPATEVPMPAPAPAVEASKLTPEQQIAALEEKYTGKTPKKETLNKKTAEPAVESPQERPVVDKVAEIRPGTPEGDSIAAARAAAEKLEQRNAQLEERIAKLEAQLSAREPATAGNEQTAATGSAEAAPASQEGRPQGPGEGEQAMDELDSIEQMGDTSEPGWLEQQGVRMEATTHDFWAYWWNIWAKRAKDSLKKRDVKVKDLEKKGKAMAERSWMGTAMNPLVYGPRIVWHKWRKGLLEAAQIRHDARRVVHENSRNELLNDLMRRYRIPLRTYEAQGEEYAGASENIDSELDMADTMLKEMDLTIARERNPQRKAQLLATRSDINEEYREQAERKKSNEELWKESVKHSSRIQSVINQIGKYANLPSSDTHPGDREKLDTRQKRQPKQPKTKTA